MMSRSLTESARRRAEPASSTRSEAEMRAQRLDDPLADLQGLVEQHPGLRRLADAGREGLEHGLLELRPEAAHVAQLLRLGRRAQALERVDAELVVELAGPLGAEAGQPREVDEAGRDAAAQLLDGRDRARLEQRLDLLLERAPDAGQLGDLALARHGRDRARRLAHGLGGVAVGEHAVHDGAVELVEVGQLVEERGDGGVGRIGHGRWPIRYAALHDRTRLARPAHLQRGREPRDRRRRRPSRARPRPRPRAFACSSSTTARPTAPAPWPTSWPRRTPARSRCCTGPCARGWARRTWRASGGRSRLARATCSRWTPTSRTTRRTSRACSPPCATTAPTSRWARATWPAAASPTGASSGASSAAAGPGTRGAPWACRCATSPAASSAFAPTCCARSTCPASARAATPSRSS